MTKNTSIVLIAVVAALVISSVLAVTMTNAAFAKITNNNNPFNKVNTGKQGHENDGSGGPTGDVLRVKPVEG